MLSQRSLGAAGKKPIPVDDEFNTVSFLSHFDGTNNGVNNVFDDSSSSNHTITANGNVTQGSFGPFARPDGEWAVAFDGTGDFIEGPSVDLLGSGAFTVECWVNVPSKTTASNYTDAFLAQYQSNGNLIIGSKSNVVRVWMGSSEVRVGTVGIVGNGWHHIALTRNSSGSVRLFVDGSADGAAFTNSTDFSQNLENFEIGSWDNGANSALNGNISNLRVVKGTAVYDPSASTITVPTSSLTAIANTSLLTCQSNRFVDNSTNSHTLTQSGQTAVSAFGPFLTSEVYSAGVNGASGYFDGSGDYLDVANSSDLVLGTDDFTIEAWAYPTTYNTGNASIIMQRVNGGSNNGWLFGISSGGLWQFSTGAAVIKRSTAAAGMNEWTHLAAVRNGSSYNFFVNGVSVGTSTTMYNFTDTTTFQLGWQSSFAEFTGYVCDARVIKGTAVYTSNFTPPTTPLTAVTNTKLLLNMADGQAIDSAAQNDLTLYGDAKISNAQSKFGGTSLYLDGTDDYAQIPTTSAFAFGTGDFTIEGFFFLSTQTQYDNLFDFRSGGDGNGVDLYFDNNPLRIIVFFGGNDQITASSGTPTNQWVHIAVVRSGSTTTLYQNGVSLGTSTAVQNFTASGCRIGARFALQYAMEGYVDEFRVSNTARYTSNFTAPTEPFADKGQ